jgi:RHS repeat-associated protein
LTQVTLPSGVTVNYKYDGLGRRIQRTTTGGTNERYIYDGNDVLLDLNADWSVATTYLNGPGIDNHLRQTSATTGVSYYLTDHLGSTVALTDSIGNVVEQLVYDSFGNNAGSARARYGYSGRERDPNTGLLHYRARFYDPQLGRFISEDPIGFEGHQENFYGYVANNPLNLKDPQGSDIAVIENGPTSYTPWSGNPIGHTAIAISCHGVYSFGNGTRRGSSLLEYLRREAPKRNTTIYVIKTTCEEDEAAMQATWDYGDRALGGVLSDNCSSRVNHALDAAKIGGTANFPELPGTAGVRADLSGKKGRKYIVPQNYRVNFLPPDLAQFEPKNFNDCSCKCKK